MGILPARKSFVLALFVLIMTSFLTAWQPVQSSAALQTVTAYFPLIFRQSQLTPPPRPSVVYVEDESSFAYVSALSGSLHVMGEVVNNTTGRVSQIEVGVRLYNDSGSLVGSGSGEVILTTLQAGEKTCFDATFLAPPAGWKRYEFDAPRYTFTTQEIPALSLVSWTSLYTASTGEYSLKGQIRNDDEGIVDNVAAIATLYNVDGRVTGCSRDFVDSVNLYSGYTSSFEVQFYGRNYSDVTANRLQLDGQIRP